MVGIISYGAHIPWLRISRKTISSAMGWFSPSALPGEKAVANYDEDSITMAVAAGVDCLNSFAREKIDGLCFATTTSPYTERQGAGIVATALDFRPDIRIADFTDSTKAGTTALLFACDAVKAGSAKNILVCASDRRVGKAGSNQEQIYGDSGAALLIGNNQVIATIEGFYSVSYDFMDRWRAEGDAFEDSAEDRFIRDEGYVKFVPEAISGLLNKYKLGIKDFAKIIYPCPYAREHAAIGKKLGAEPNQIQDNMIASVGDTGTAYSLMMLVAALEEAKPGDKILVASYGNGSDALFLQVTDEIERVRSRKVGIKSNLALKQELSSYEKYLSFRNLITIEEGIRAVEFARVATPIPMAWRERRDILALYGSRCKRCGTPQYPPQRVCVNPSCGAIDEMEPYRFSDKTGHLIAYTGDNLSSTISPPQIYAMVDFDGGGRYWFDFADCELDSVKVGMTVKLGLRKKYIDKARGIHGYFWKAIPLLRKEV